MVPQPQPSPSEVPPVPAATAQPSSALKHRWQQPLCGQEEQHRGPQVGGEVVGGERTWEEGRIGENPIQVGKSLA